MCLAALPEWFMTKKFFLVKSGAAAGDTRKIQSGFSVCNERLMGEKLFRNLLFVFHAIALWILMVAVDANWFQVAVNRAFAEGNC